MEKINEQGVGDNDGFFELNVDKHLLKKEDLERFTLAPFDAHREAINSACKKIAALNERSAEQVVIVKLNERVSYLEGKLKDLEGKLKDLEGKLKDLEGKLKDLEELIKAVAHIGVDFGYGKYELEQKHIDKAREIYEATQDN